MIESTDVLVVWQLFVVFLMSLPVLLILFVIWRWLRPDKIVPATASGSVADELIKLQQLHEQGVLTEQEFEEQKRRVLC